MKQSIIIDIYGGKMNFIDRAFEQKLTGDDFLQAMADIYNELEVEAILYKYPGFVKDVLLIIDYDTTLQMEGLDEIINGSLCGKFNDIVAAMKHCGLADEVNVLEKAKELYDSSPEKYDDDYDSFEQQLALNNNYEDFWDCVRAYIDKNLSSLIEK